MRINNNKKTYDQIAFDTILERLSEQYDSIVCTEIMDEVFIYRPITRYEYRNIMLANLEDAEKQDLICDTCVLYPENYSWDDCIGGIPNELCTEILDK